MSFVSIIATENFLNVMSDGRVVGENNIVLQEDYRKFICPAQNYFVAFAGQKEPCEAFIAESGLMAPDLSNMPAFADKISQQLKSDRFRIYKILLAFGGKADGSIFFATVSTLEPNIQVFQPKDDDINYAFLNNSKAINVDLEKQLIEALRITGYDTPDKSLNAQGILNDAVAEMDGSVNCTTFPLSILK